MLWFDIQDDFDYDRPRHNVSAAGYLKFLGQELLWEQIEEDEIMEHLYNDADITKLRSLITEAMFEKLTYSSFISKSMEFIQHWRKGYIYDYLNKGEVSLWNETFNFTKAASLLDIKTVIPTILGMPLYLDSKATGYLQLDAGSIVTYKTEHPIYDSLPTWIQKLFGYEEEKMVNIYGEITPKQDFVCGLSCTAIDIPCFIGSLLQWMLNLYWMHMIISQSLVSLLTQHPTSHNV